MIHIKISSYYYSLTNIIIIHEIAKNEFHCWTPKLSTLNWTVDFRPTKWITFTYCLIYFFPLIKDIICLGVSKQYLLSNHVK